MPKKPKTSVVLTVPSDALQQLVELSSKIRGEWIPASRTEVTNHNVIARYGLFTNNFSNVESILKAFGSVSVIWGFISAVDIRGSTAIVLNLQSPDLLRFREMIRSNLDGIKEPNWKPCVILGWVKPEYKRLALDAFHESNGPVRLSSLTGRTANIYYAGLQYLNSGYCSYFGLAKGWVRS